MDKKPSMKYLIFLLIFFISGCEVGYKKSSNSIAWVHWNEGTGRVAKIMDVRDPENVEILSHEYAKDSEKVFYQGILIEGADPASFKILNQTYSSDKRAVYFQQFIVEGAPPGTFKPINLNYGASKESVYFRHHLIHGAVPSSFTISAFEYSDVYGCYLLAHWKGCTEAYVQ